MLMQDSNTLTLSAIQISILQVIANCTHLTEFFLSPPSKDHQRLRLYYKFANAIHSMITGRPDVVNPYNSVEIFKSYHKILMQMNVRMYCDILIWWRMLYYHIVVLLYCDIVVLSYCSVVMNCHIVVLLCWDIVLLSCCSVVLYYHIVVLLYFDIVMLSY